MKEKINTQQEDDSDEDSEDDWLYYLPPQDAHPQAGNEERYIGQAADSELTGAHHKQGEQQERLTQLREGPGEIELLDSDEAPEEMEILGDNPAPPPVSPPPRDNHSESEQVQDEFGNPVCYSMGPPAKSMYRFNPMQHYRIHQPGTM